MPEKMLTSSPFQAYISINRLNRMIDTPGKLLDAAERLFATQGFAAVSLRQIIAEADVNVAAVHYHFGSKQELLDQVIMRKAGPVNRERLELLDRAEADANGNPEVEAILGAFMLPMAQTATDNPLFPKLMGRMQSEGILSEVIERNFQPVITRFLVALRKAVPHLPDNEFRWRIHFMQGAIAGAMSSEPHAVSHPVDDGGFRKRIERLIVFLGAGLRVPSAGEKPPKPSGKNK
jgi:AcrR family transcriptional regulator